MLGKGEDFAARKVAIAAAACSIVLPGMLPSSAIAWGPYNHLNPAFCDTTTVRGNPGELRKLPPLRRAPTSMQLPFAPETTRFRPYDEFQVGEGKIGFALRQGDGHRTDTLDLIVDAAFMRIDRRGRTIEMLGQTQTHISSIKGYETVPFSLPITKPGFYRANVSFQDTLGKRLGRYGTYTRLLPLVVRPPRLALNAKVFRLGERVLARVENFSRTSVSYGVSYSIERWNGGRWERAPGSPDGPWIMPLYRSRPGETGPCLPFRTPDSMEPGLYRMVKPVRTSHGARKLFAKFKVGN